MASSQANFVRFPFASMGVWDNAREAGLVFRADLRGGRLRLGVRNGSAAGVLGNSVGVIPCFASASLTGC